MLLKKVFIAAFALLTSFSSAFSQGWNIEPVCYIPFWEKTWDIEYQDSLAFVAGGASGLCIVDVSDPYDPTQVAFKIDTSFSGVGGVDLNGDRILLNGSHFTPPNIYDACVVLLDISDPINPAYVSSYISPNRSFNNAILEGDFAYIVSSEDELVILDFSDPADPTLAAVFPLQGEGYPMIAIDNLLYVGVAIFYEGGVEIIDISEPYAPRQVGFCNLGPASSNLELCNGYLLALCFDALKVLDVSDPINPRIVSTLAMNSSLGMAISEGRAYCGWNLYGGLAVVDVSNPLTPQLMGTCDLPDQVLGVAACGTVAYAADSDSGLRVVDAANPYAPVELSHCGESNRIYEIDLSDGYAFLCGSWWGFLIVNTADPDSIIGQFQSQDYVYSVAASDSCAYAASSDDFQVLSIINPAYPTILGSLEFGQYVSPSEIAIEGSFAFIPGSRFAIVDISNPYQPQLLSCIDWPYYKATGTCILDTLAFVSAITGTYPNFGGCIQVQDVSNPAMPQQVGYLQLPDRAFDVVLSGGYAFVAEDEEGLCIVDISNYASIQIVTTYNTSGSAQQVAVSEDHVFLADEEGGLLVFDVTDPTNPILTGSYDTPGEAYDLAVDGNLVYMADLYYFSTYDASAALAPVTVSLTPVNPPIQIPASGGSFSFNTNLTNATTSAQTFDFWIMARLPDQSLHGPVLGPLTLTMQSEVTLTRLRTQSVPANAPAGEYWYEARVGDYPMEVWDTGGFGFTKLGNGGGVFETQEWENIGDYFTLDSEPTPTCNSSVKIFTNPNPFNATTRLVFTLPTGAKTSLKVYDLQGRQVANLVDAWLDAGYHDTLFDGSDLPSGIYLARLTAGHWSSVQKMVLMK